MFRIATDPRASTGLADIMDRWTVTDVCNMHDALDFRDTMGSPEKSEVNLSDLGFRSE